MLITGKEFRDWSAESNFPFTDDSTLDVGMGLGAMPRDAVLDMLVAAPGDWAAPFHVSALDGLAGTFLMEVSGSGSSKPLTAGPSTNWRLLDSDSIDRGVVVPGPGMDVLMANIGRRRSEMDYGSLTLCAGRCFNTWRTGRPLLKVNGRTVSGVLRLVAAGEYRFTGRGGLVNLEWDPLRAPSVNYILAVGVDVCKCTTGEQCPLVYPCDALVIRGGGKEQSIYVDNTSRQAIVRGAGCDA
jgi:hypothetical protein